MKKIYISKILIIQIMRFYFFPILIQIFYIVKENNKQQNLFEMFYKGDIKFSILMIDFLFK